MSRRALLLTAAAVLAAPMVAQAQETRAGVEVAATGGYSNNPFAETGSGTGSAFAAIDVTPDVKLLTERSTFTLSGLAHVQEYTNRYPVTDSYRVSLDYRGRPSARLTTFAHLDLSSAVLGSDDDYVLGSVTGVAAPVGGVQTGGTGTGATTGGSAADPISSGYTSGPLISDIGLLGTRDRRRSLYATAGGTAALSARDSLSVSGFADLARYSRFGDVGDYDGYGGTVGYSRQVSAYFQAGVQGSASRYDYREQGDTSIYSVQATGSGRLNSRWTIDGALGVSFVNSDAAGSNSLTSLSGNISLCRKDERDTLCGQASRQARATGFNGSQYVTTAGVNWRHRIDARSGLTLDGSYLQEGGVTRLNGVQNQYLRASVAYDRQLRERLRLLVSTRYRRVFGGDQGRASDFGGQVGLSYRFGDNR